MPASHAHFCWGMVRTGRVHGRGGRAGERGDITEPLESDMGFIPTSADPQLCVLEPSKLGFLMCKVDKTWGLWEFQ